MRKSDGAVDDVTACSSDYRDLADFRYAIRLFLREAEEQAAQAGSTAQQRVLLLAIRGHASSPEVTVGDIAERLQIRHASASRLVERAVQCGLLQRREASADRRRAYVSLSEEGREVLERITRATKRELSLLQGALFRGSLRQALHAHGSPSDRAARA
jgi:DNA-binding MarR family transcriptional regulator